MVWTISVDTCLSDGVLSQGKQVLKGMGVWLWAVSCLRTVGVWVAWAMAYRDKGLNVIKVVQALLIRLRSCRRYQKVWFSQLPR